MKRMEVEVELFATNDCLPYESTFQRWQAVVGLHCSANGLVQ